VTAGLTEPPSAGLNGRQRSPRRSPRGRESVRRFVIRRLASAVLVLLGVLFAVFAAVELSPSDAARARLGVFVESEAVDRLASEYGLDDPLLVRYGRFLLDLTHFELGESVLRPESVSELIARSLPVTLELTMLATVIAVLTATVFGLLAAWREGRLTDRLINTAAAVSYASPEFWTGVLFIQVFAVSLGWLPSGGYVPASEGLGPWFSSVIGPALILALPFTAVMVRVIRTSMVEELGKDYVRTAVGSGLPWRTVLGRNVLRNAMISPLTVFGLYFGSLISGAVLVEAVFNVPGLGSLLVTAVTQGDLAVVRGVAIVSTVAFIGINLVVDLLYVALNPRGAEVSTR
jgi:peptide/nickel transport system permease protein